MYIHTYTQWSLSISIPKIWTLCLCNLPWVPIYIILLYLNTHTYIRTYADKLRITIDKASYRALGSLQSQCILTTQIPPSPNLNLYKTLVHMYVRMYI